MAEEGIGAAKGTSGVLNEATEVGRVPSVCIPSYAGDGVVLAGLQWVTETMSELSDPVAGDPVKALSRTSRIVMVPISGTLSLPATVPKIEHPEHPHNVAVASYLPVAFFQLSLDLPLA